MWKISAIMRGDITKENMKEQLDESVLVPSMNQGTMHLDWAIGPFERLVAMRYRGLVAEEEARAKRESEMQAGGQAGPEEKRSGECRQAQGSEWQPGERSG